MIEIPLLARDGSVRAYTLVDAADAEWLSEWRWCLHNDGYAARWETVDSRFRTVFMHRAILGLEHGDPRKTDHVNRDRLDNRRANLRIATNAENSQNIPAKGGSRHRGVSFHKQSGKWMARGKLNGVEHYLGLYDDEHEAARASAAWRAAHMPYSAEGMAA